MKPGKLVQYSLFCCMIFILSIPIAILYGYSPKLAGLFVTFLIWLFAGFMWETNENERWGDLWFSLIALGLIIFADNFIIKFILDIIFLTFWIHWLMQYLEEVIKSTIKKK